MTLEPLDFIASAAHYAGQAGAEMVAADLEPEVRMEHIAAAQVWATLSDAAATLEAAGPPWPDAAMEMEDQYAPYYCSREWVDEEAVIPSQVDGPDARAHDGKPHRCVHPAGHEHEEPHYCHCGAEL